MSKKHETRWVERRGDSQWRKWVLVNDRGETIAQLEESKTDDIRRGMDHTAIVNQDETFFANFRDITDDSQYSANSLWPELFRDGHGMGKGPGSSDVGGFGF